MGVTRKNGIAVKVCIKLNTQLFADDEVTIQKNDVGLPNFQVFQESWKKSKRRMPLSRIPIA